VKVEALTDFFGDRDSNKELSMHKGSCLCGKVQFSFNQHEGDFVHCHCPSCRKAGGTNGAINIAVSLAEFELKDDEQVVKTFESSPNKFRHFCSHCGSPLFTKVGTNADYVRVRLGSLDTEFNEQPKAHIFMGLKASWDDPALTIDAYNDWPDFDKIDIRGATKGKHK
jgi:hypothetical protein